MAPSTSLPSLPRRPVLDGSSVEYVKQTLWSLGQEAVDNRLTARVVEARSIDRDALLGGHPAVTECVRYGEAETARFPPPISAGSLPDSIADRPESVRVDRPFVCELRDVQLVGPNALTFAADGGVVLENALGFRRRVTMSALRCLASGVLPRRGSTARSYDVGLSLVGPWCHNYYHWLIDYVTRLRAIPTYSERTGRTPQLLLPQECSEWMLEALRIAGFEADDWTVLDRDRVAVDRLVVPSLSRGVSEYFDREDMHNVYGTSPSAVRWLRSTFRSNVDRSDGVDAPERIYVSREGASLRRVKNRDALEDVLDAYGFEALRPERYSVREQVAMFADAEAVLGPTGAGLVNAVFADDPALIALYGATTHPIYYVLGSLLDFDVGCLQCEAVGEDLVVDPDDLRTVLDGLDLD